MYRYIAYVCAFFSDTSQIYLWVATSAKSAFKTKWRKMAAILYLATYRIYDIHVPVTGVILNNIPNGTQRNSLEIEKRH